MKTKTGELSEEQVQILGLWEELLAAFERLLVVGISLNATQRLVWRSGFRILLDGKWMTFIFDPLEFPLGVKWGEGENEEAHSNEEVAALLRRAIDLLNSYTPSEQPRLPKQGWGNKGPRKERRSGW